jgi:hypothetical protein
MQWAAAQRDKRCRVEGARRDVIQALAGVGGASPTSALGLRGWVGNEGWSTRMNAALGTLASAVDSGTETKIDNVSVAMAETALSTWDGDDGHP